MTKEEARDAGIAAKAIKDADENRFDPPLPSGLDRLGTAVFTFGLSEAIGRDAASEHAQEVYIAAHEGRKTGR